MKEERSLSQRGCAEGGGRAAVADGAVGADRDPERKPSTRQRAGQEAKNRGTPLGGSVVKIPCFHCRGHGLDPSWGTKIPRDTGPK